MATGALAELLGTFALVFGAAGAVTIPGPNINPAVTLGFALTKHLPWKDAAAYWTAQGAGAIVAAAVLRGVMGPVAGIGRHTPAGGTAEAAVMEVALTLLLMFVILVGGPISGGSMNPARSLGPALLTWTWSGQ